MNYIKIKQHTGIHKILCVTAVVMAMFYLSSCKPQRLEENVTAFTLSDTMMKRCEFYKADVQEVKNRLLLYGKIAADNNKLAQVYPIVGGVVININVELGDYVKQGQVLASIRSGEVATYEKERLDAQNDVAIAEKNLQVAKDLYKGKLNSEKDVLAAERELDKAKAELNRINEIYKIYSLSNGSIYNVVAPISGFVITKKINQNEQIRSDNSEPLFSIADINEVWALANVNESDIATVKVGFDAELKTLAFPKESYTGKIDKIFNAIDPDTRSMKVRVKIPNADFKLKPDMNCTVSISYSEGRTMLTVPSSAVIFDRSKYWVMVFRDKHNIETRQVQLYRQLSDMSYISGGLDEGETVISKNALLVYDALND